MLWITTVKKSFWKFLESLFMLTCYTTAHCHTMETYCIRLYVVMMQHHKNSWVVCFRIVREHFVNVYNLWTQSCSSCCCFNRKWRTDYLWSYAERESYCGRLLISRRLDTTGIYCQWWARLKSLGDSRVYFWGYRESMGTHKKSIFFVFCHKIPLYLRKYSERFHRPILREKFSRVWKFSFNAIKYVNVCISYGGLRKHKTILRNRGSISVKSFGKLNIDIDVGKPSAVGRHTIEFSALKALEI